MSKRMNITRFLCAKCNTAKLVEAQGEVISGPACPVCRQPMRRVTAVQAELDLFPQPPRRRTKRGDA